MEDILKKHLAHWEKLEKLESWYTNLEEFSFDFGSYLLWGDSSYRSELKKTMHHDFEIMALGTSNVLTNCTAMSSAPINIPGSAWNLGITARQRMVINASKLIEEIRQQGNYGEKGLVGAWLYNLQEKGIS